MALDRLGTGHPRDRSVGELTGELQHGRSECGDQYRNPRDARELEARGDPVVLPLVCGRLALEERTQNLQVLAHVSCGPVVGHPEHALDDELVG